MSCKVYVESERYKTSRNRKCLLSCKGQKELITAGKWALSSTQKVGEREEKVPRREKGKKAPCSVPVSTKTDL